MHDIAGDSTVVTYDPEDHLCHIGKVTGECTLTEEMEQLVAGPLRSMGYHAETSPTESDEGCDVVASPDLLDPESPRVITGVKHRKSPVGASQVRAFIGGLRADDRGLYVSTGGFAREARYEADRANVPVRLLDLDGFVKLHVVPSLQARTLS